MEQAEEAAAETEAECRRGFGREGERGIVELKFLERGAQILEISGFDGIDAGEHHRLDFEAFDGFAARALVDMRDCVADFHFLAGLDARDNVSHIACRQLGAGRHSDFVGMVFLTGSHEFHKIAFAYRAVDNFEISYDAAERVEYRVEDKSLQRCFRGRL